MDKLSTCLKAVGLKGTCHNCGNEVEIIITKKQLKALLKGMKTGNPIDAELMVEKILGRDKKTGTLGK